MTLRNCSKCYRKLNLIEMDLFGEGSSDIYRDCWINENFEPRQTVGIRA